VEKKVFGGIVVGFSVMLWALVWSASPGWPQKLELPKSGGLEVPPPPPPGSVSTPAGVSADPPVPSTPSAPQSGTPEIFCAEPSKEFGLLYLGEKWEHSYIVENKGTANLTISNVAKDCGCTGAKALAMEIAPGATTEVQVVFDAGRHPLKVKKKVTVHSNDPVTPARALEFIGQVTSAFRFEPVRMPQFGPLTKGATAEKSIDIFVIGGQPVELLKVESTSPLIHILLLTRILSLRICSIRPP